MAESSLDTRELVAKAQAGCPDAFSALIGRYQHRLYALVRLRLGHRLRQRVDSDDILQETFLKAYESLHTFEWRGDGSFFRWLSGIAEHVLKDLARHHLQTKKRAQTLEVPLHQRAKRGQRAAADLADSRAASPSKIMQRNERFDRLERALDRLSPEHREVIILARIRGLPIHDIAVRMNRSPDAVSMLLLRALRRLRSYFGTTDSVHLPATRTLDKSAHGECMAAGDGPDDEKGKDRVRPAEEDP